MYWIRCLGTAICGVIGGVLGNLAAAVLDNTVGQFTVKQALAMLAGAVLFVLLASALEQWARRPKRRELEHRLTFHRQELRRLERAFEIDKTWTPLHQAAWQESQDQIGRIRQALDQRGSPAPQDPYDLRPPPLKRMRTVTRLWLRLRRSTVLLAFPLAAVVSWLCSPAAQQGYLALTEPSLPPIALVSATPVIRPSYPPSLSTPAQTAPVMTSLPKPTQTATPTASPTSPFNPTYSPSPLPMPTATRPLFPPPSGTPKPTAQCPNAGAQITSPAMDSLVGGTVSFLGTASIPDFSYYKFEYRPDEAATWAFVMRALKSQVNDVLMEWDTSALSPGVYWLRLVVVDSTGNYVEPCQVRVTVMRE
jgi:hypothetical protein